MPISIKYAYALLMALIIPQTESWQYTQYTKYEAKT